MAIGPATIPAAVIRHVAEAIRHRGDSAPDITAETDFDAIAFEPLTEFGIEVSEAEAARWSSVADVVACVRGHVGEGVL